MKTSVIEVFMSSDLTRRTALTSGIVTAAGLVGGRALAEPGPATAPEIPATTKGAAPTGAANPRSAALRTYVPPGAFDEYYMFIGAGHSGNATVYGLPSMRLLVTIPVFTPSPSSGYGFDRDSKEMLGGFTWGDVHHPSISQTHGDYDGRWLFVSDIANNRLARIDLRDFRTKQIFGPIPNASGIHCSTFLTENTEYVLAASRFSIPLPKGTYDSLEDYAKNYKGVIAGIAVNPVSGEMTPGWQVLMPPFQYDIGDAGKGPSTGWAFWTSFNSERATGKLEDTTAVSALDYVAAVNWKAAERAVVEGKYKTIGGAKVIDPKDVPGVVYLIPAAKSPHGLDVTPDGRYVVLPGKLAPFVTVFSVEKMLAAIQKKDFTGNEDGIPVLNPDSVKVVEVPVGPGSLHTQFDDKGFAYTSLYDDGVIVKWKLGTWQIVDKLSVAYNIGHLSIPGSNTKHPAGDYLVALNKTTRAGGPRQHLSVGPMQPKSLQLIAIDGEKMELLYDAFADPEPHVAQIISANRLKPIEVYPKAENHNPNAIWSTAEGKAVRKGNEVTVHMTLEMSNFSPTSFEVHKGDRVVVHLTNIEDTPDEGHGFAISEYNINVVVDAGDTKTVEFIAEKPGVFPYYCSVFCSAHHEEMQGYMLVKPTA